MVRQERLEFAAGLAALVVAGVHLYWGIPRFVAYASIGSMPDPRPLAFVLSGHAIVGAITLVVLGVIQSRWLYLPGMALMVVHLVGYAAWHTVLSHGGAGPTTAADHSHASTNPVDVVLVAADHVVNSPLAFVSKTSELLLLALLAALCVSSSVGRNAA